jgi:HK97 gp10 family phage protein
VSVSVTFIPDLGAISGLTQPGGMVYDFIEGKAGECASLAKGLAPVETGELRDSIYSQPFSEGGVFGFEVGATAEHALFQEVGTIHHGPQPYLRPAFEATFGGFSGYG